MTPVRQLQEDWFPEPLPPNVVLGARTWLYSAYAFLHYCSQRPIGLRVGSDCGLYIHTFFELGPSGEVDIGDYCTLAGVRICTNGRVRIGERVLLSLDVVIADTFAPIPATVAFDDAHEPRSGSNRDIVIEDDAWIGTRATILPGAHIGTGAIVGAAAVIDFDVPPYAIVAGNPARIVGWAPPGCASR